MILAGADGCSGGWVCLGQDARTGKITGAFFATAQGLIHQTPTPLILAIDIPIGLSDMDPRKCDVEARRLLGFPRRCSVFPAPIRAALGAENWCNANKISKAHAGKGMSHQTFGILPKVREVDEVLQADRTLWDRVREVHPEVSFREWNGGVAVPSKKSAAGSEKRKALIADAVGADAFEAACAQVRRQAHGVRGVRIGDDDLVDAFAALWTARRVASGEAKTVPESSETDATGLRMAIWY